MTSHDSDTDHMTYSPLYLSINVDIEAVICEKFADHWEKDRLKFLLSVISFTELVEIKTHHFCTVSLVVGSAGEGGEGGMVRKRENGARMM